MNHKHPEYYSIYFKTKEASNDGTGKLQGYIQTCGKEIGACISRAG
jgi:hypothetical protein